MTATINVILTIFDFGHIASGAVGGIVAVFAAHFLKKDRERRRDKKFREQASDDARAARRRDFLGLVAEIKARISTQTDPRNWVSNFRTIDAPKLQAEFDKIAAELEVNEMVKMRDVVGEILAIARRDKDANIHADKSKILELFNRIPSA
jgi:hypothetical protein